MTSTVLLLASLASLATAPEPEPFAREFRAVWVATVGNIDWPSRTGLDLEAQKREADAILDLAASTGLNAVVLQIRASADAFYDSPIEPWSAYLTGRQGESPGYDPLAYWCDQAHRRGLLLHAWLNPFRARVAGARYEASIKDVGKARPDLVRGYGTSQWLDPGEPEARDQTLRVVIDVVKRYDVDGIHIDDYFYPYPIPDPARPGHELEFPDEASWTKAKSAGVTLSRSDWRRDNINRLIEQMAKSIKATKSTVLFGISPFGIPRPGLPPGVVGFDQYDKLSADALLWLENGWADYFSPQLYWKVDAPGQPFRPLLDYWISRNVTKKHLWPGLSISRVSDRPNGYEPGEILRQVAIIRETPGASGHVLFSMKALQNNRRGIADRLRLDAYTQPALIPLSPWINAKPPGKPSVTTERIPGQNEVTLTIQQAEGTPFLWAIQTKTRTGWTCRVVPATERRVTMANMEEAVVSAVDRLGNASEAVNIDSSIR